jgi:NAD(P)-dependent dehydrogenase (short-subunit alcohol dehydrogenase family)
MTSLDLFRLDGRVAVVTGASSGLGVAFAQGLAEAGADVVLGARRVERLEQTAQLVEAAGRRAVVVATDVTDPDACTALVQAAVDELGKVDVLVNNAGVGTAVPATRETPEQFRSVVDLNLNGCYWMAQACGRVMQPGSSIINISSVLGLTTAGLPQAAYSASKAVLIGLTRDLAQQWTGRKGIRVNAIAPGSIEFPGGVWDQRKTDNPTLYERTLKSIPFGRFGTADEIAEVALFLASPHARWITGQVLSVDGGQLLGA